MPPRPFGPAPKPPPRAKKKPARLAPRSKKQRAAYDGEGGEEGRRALVARLLEGSGYVGCEAGHHIGRHLCGLPPSNHRRATDPIYSRCGREATDVHEILPRGRGGSIKEPTNLLRVCRLCHEWIHEHPADAGVLGLLLSSHPPGSA
jgi:hypothetical protein